MNDVVLDILKDALGTYELSYDGNVMFYCPFCRHVKRKLSVKVDSGIWRCWVCPNKGRTLVGLLIKINTPQSIINRLKSITSNPYYQSTIPNASSNIPTDTIHLPKEYVRLSDAPYSVERDLCLKYLFSRGVTECDIFRYRIGYADSGKYANMVIIPNYNIHGELTYFTTRAYSPYALKKMRNPKLPKVGVIGFEDTINFDVPICVSEGPFDAITLRFNSIPKYGKFISQTLRERLLDAPEIIFCPDGDAIIEALSDVQYFMNMNIPCKLIVLRDGEDPNSLGFNKMWDLINSSKYLTNNDLLKLRLQCTKL